MFLNVWGGQQLDYFKLRQEFVGLVWKLKLSFLLIKVEVVLRNVLLNEKKKFSCKFDSMMGRIDINVMVMYYMFLK